jgi:AcrR family transcriptional regulator
MTSRVEQRKKDTRARIVDAALDLFARHGIDATTIAQISEAADIGKGTFFTYFPTKEAVFVDVGAVMLSMMTEGATQALAAGPRAQLEQLLVPALQWHQQHPALSRLSIEVLMRTAPVLEVDASNIGALHGLLAGLVAQGQAEGHFKPGTSPDVAATLITGLYFMALQRWHARKGEGSVVDDYRAGLSLVMQGLAA